MPVATLLESKFINFALKFVNSLLKYPEYSAYQLSEVDLLSLHFTKPPLETSLYLPYSLAQIEKSMVSVSLLLQHEEA